MANATVIRGLATVGKRCTPLNVYTCTHDDIPYNTTPIFNDRVSMGGRLNAISSVRPSVRLSVFILTFEPSDL